MTASYVSLKSISFPLSVQLDVPSSKSISNRLLILKETFAPNINIRQLSTADDTQLLMRLLLEIKTNLYSSNTVKTLDARNCGTAFRFLCAYLCFKKGKWLLTGSDAMKNRPINELVDVLSACGATINYAEKEGFPPLQIHTSKSLHIGSLLIVDSQRSSQFVSALLLVLPLMKQNINLQISENTSSLPYLSMTLSLMQSLGIGISMQHNNLYYNYTPPITRKFTMTVEPDWSAAAYWCAWLALHKKGSCFIKGLKKSEFQADSIIETIVSQFGVCLNYQKEGAFIHKVNDSKPSYLDFNARSCLDLVPTIAVLCCGLQIKASIKGIANLAYKESNRIETLIKELGQIATINYNGTSLEILPLHRKNNLPLCFHTYNDHRLAMSFALLVGIFPEVHIENPDCVSKSYPEFWQQLQKLGVECKDIISNN
ncbi:MAG: hypothetical protein PHC83_00990 [Bacteroidales bacterium]|nr:hypothetical protein [Bacteroidales bacterium]MDD4209808.1 hypothetical protein [Bacteroidales bacterium]